MQDYLVYDFLHRYVIKKHLKWKVLFGNNYSGVHVGKKTTAGKKQENYSIVFHVKKKLKLPPIPIPKSIKIKLPSNKSLTIPTDVIEMGGISLQTIILGDDVKRVGDNFFPGGIGAFFTKGNNYYALSNMHVLGSLFVQQGDRYKYIPPQEQSTDIILYRDGLMCNASFEIGYFNSIDAALARILDPSIIHNLLPNGNPKNGVAYISYQNYHGYSVHLGGAESGICDGAIQEMIAIHDYGEIELSNFYLADFASASGDSGSPVYDDNDCLVGIHSGRDSSQNLAIIQSINHINSIFSAYTLF